MITICEGIVFTDTEYISVQSEDGAIHNCSLLAELLPHEEWSEDRGRLVQVYQSAIDIDQIQVRIPHGLVIYGSMRLGTVSILSTKATGYIAEFSDTQPFFGRAFTY